MLQQMLKKAQAETAARAQAITMMDSRRRQEIKRRAQASSVATQR